MLSTSLSLEHGQSQSVRVEVEVGVDDGGDANSNVDNNDVNEHDDQGGNITEVTDENELADLEQEYETDDYNSEVEIAGEFQEFDKENQPPPTPTRTSAPTSHPQPQTALPEPKIKSNDNSLFSSDRNTNITNNFNDPTNATSAPDYNLSLLSPTNNQLDQCNQSQNSLRNTLGVVVVKNLNGDRVNIVNKGMLQEHFFPVNNRSNRIPFHSVLLAGAEQPTYTFKVSSVMQKFNHLHNHKAATVTGPSPKRLTTKLRSPSTKNPSNPRANLMHEINDLNISDRFELVAGETGSVRYTPSTKNQPPQTNQGLFASPPYNSAYIALPTASFADQTCGDTFEVETDHQDADQDAEENDEQFGLLDQYNELELTDQGQGVGLETTIDMDSTREVTVTLPAVVDLSQSYRDNLTQSESEHTMSIRALDLNQEYGTDLDFSSTEDDTAAMEEHFNEMESVDLNAVLAGIGSTPIPCMAVKQTTITSISLDHREFSQFSHRYSPTDARELGTQISMKLLASPPSQDKSKSRRSSSSSSKRRSVDHSLMRLSVNKSSTNSSRVSSHTRRVDTSIQSAANRLNQLQLNKKLKPRAFGAFGMSESPTPSPEVSEQLSMPDKSVVIGQKRELFTPGKITLSSQTVANHNITQLTTKTTATKKTVTPPTTTATQPKPALVSKTSPSPRSLHPALPARRLLHDIIPSKPAMKSKRMNIINTLNAVNTVNLTTATAADLKTTQPQIVTKAPRAKSVPKHKNTHNKDMFFDLCSTTNAPKQNIKVQETTTAQQPQAIATSEKSDHSEQTDKVEKFRPFTKMHKKQKQPSANQENTPTNTNNNFTNITNFVDDVQLNEPEQRRESMFEKVIRRRQQIADNQQDKDSKKKKVTAASRYRVQPRARSVAR